MNSPDLWFTFVWGWICIFYKFANGHYYFSSMLLILSVTQRTEFFFHTFRQYIHTWSLMHPCMGVRLDPLLWTPSSECRHYWWLHPICATPHTATICCQVVQMDSMIWLGPFYRPHSYFHCSHGLPVALLCHLCWRSLSWTGLTGRAQLFCPARRWPSCLGSATGKWAHNCFSFCLFSSILDLLVNFCCKIDNQIVIQMY